MSASRDGKKWAEAHLEHKSCGLVVDWLGTEEKEGVGSKIRCLLKQQKAGLALD